MIYLDNAATTPITTEIFEVMKPYLTENFGNPGGVYELGRRSAEAVAIARKQVANLIGTTPEHILFTASGSEANNLAIKGAVPHLKNIGKPHIITTAIEHDSVVNAVKNTCYENVGLFANFLNVDRTGKVDVENLKKQIGENTGFVSVMFVNNEIGTINPVTEIAEICKRHGALFHTDCVQALGFQNVDVNEIDCDFLSVSAHKINAPKGVGALYVRNTKLLSPLICGGKGQELGLRGGTENVAGIVGFGEACNIILKETPQKRSKTVLNLKEKLVKALYDELGKYHIEHLFHVNSPENGKVLNIRFDNIDAETLVLFLDTKGICLSSGSACREHRSEPSHVLLSCGLNSGKARNSIRVSFSPYQSEKEVITAGKIIAQCVNALNEM